MIGWAFKVAFGVGLVAFAGAAPAQDTSSDDAATPDDSDAAPAETCFDVSRARDVNVLSDEHVHVRTIGGNHYLLTMAGACRNLQRSYRSGGVRIQPYGRRVCPNDGSHLLYTWFDRESVCPIQMIESVEDRAEARAIAEAGGRSPVDVEEVVVPD